MIKCSIVKKNEPNLPEKFITNKILIIRDKKVMLDRDLAELYQVDTKRLNEKVNRNINRFPKDFMFQLTKNEWKNLKSRFATSSWGGRRTEPYVFTEQGVAMLSSVLNSERAISVNIRIIRIFTKMREIFFDNQKIKLEIKEIKKNLIDQNKNIELVFEYLDQLIDKKENQNPRIKIGYKK